MTRTSKSHADSGDGPVAETFEAELAQITEKGKDLKGEQRIFYQSIVERVANNVEVLATLRTEHTGLRAKLKTLVAQKADLNERTTLEGDIKHTNHDVNLLKKQIDRIKHDKATSIERQAELEVIYANFEHAEKIKHPEDERIESMKNRLDRANIKNGETTHLEKIYQQVSYLLDRQKMRWAPAVRKSQEQIRQKDRDIAELGLISRDSRFSRDLAKSEYLRTKQQVAAEKQKRTAELERQTQEQIRIQERQQLDAGGDADKPSKAQPSINSQPSVLRNKLNKAAREKREERFRQVSALYEDIRDVFGTNDPNAIAKFFTDRRETTATLQKQIEDLKAACEVLQRQSDQLKSAIEEAEYASSKGVGGNRLLSEGNRMLVDKQGQLTRDQREVAAVEVYQKGVVAGVAHLADVMCLVQPEEEAVPLEPDAQLKWIKDKVVLMKGKLDEEDVEFLPLVNKPVFATQYAAMERQLNGEDPTPKPKPKPDVRRGRDKAGDVQSRVLDRAAVKMQAKAAVLAATTQKKKAEAPPK
jgi:hypothetical protein